MISSQILVLGGAGGLLRFLPRVVILGVLCILVGSIWPVMAQAQSVQEGPVPSFCASKADSSDLVLGDASGPSGTDVSVLLSLANTEAVKGIQADIIFDGTKAFFSGIESTIRSAGMAVEAEQISNDLVRVILYFDTEDSLAVGSDAVADLTFSLQGPGGQSTALTLDSILLSDPSGSSLDVAGVNGLLTVEYPLAAPVLQISALKNPGRPRTMNVLVRVSNGSGSAPTVSVSGSSVAMTSLGQAVYSGSYSATQTATSVSVSASDQNIQGTGLTEITVDFQ